MREYILYYSQDDISFQMVAEFMEIQKNSKKWNEQ